MKTSFQTLLVFIFCLQTCSFSLLCRAEVSNLSKRKHIHYEIINKGDDIEFDGKLLTKEGAYIDTMQTADGDSLFVLRLFVDSENTSDDEDFEIRPNKQPGILDIYADIERQRTLYVYDFGKDGLGFELLTEIEVEDGTNLIDLSDIEDFPKMAMLRLGKSLRTCYNIDGSFLPIDEYEEYVGEQEWEQEQSKRPASSIQFCFIEKGGQYKYKNKVWTEEGRYIDTLKTAEGKDSLVVMYLFETDRLQYEGEMFPTTPTEPLKKHLVINGLTDKEREVRIFRTDYETFDLQLQKQVSADSKHNKISISDLKACDDCIYIAQYGRFAIVFKIRN